MANGVTEAKGKEGVSPQDLANMNCIACGFDKPESNFPVNGRRADGTQQRQPTCRKCKRKQRESQGFCQCGRPLVTKTKCEVCRLRNASSAAKRRFSLKEKVLSHYGRECVFCQENKTLFLTVDHIDDNGAEHRKHEGITTGDKTYRWLEKNGFPPGFQVACFNCNAAKARIGAEALKEFFASRSG